MTKFFKHKTINQFTVGKFNFVNHVAAIEDKDLEEFLREYEGLQGVDKVNIVEVMNIQNERPVGGRVIRDALNTINAKDSSQGAVRASEMRNESKLAEIKTKEELLAERERIVEERERFLGLTAHAQVNGNQAIQENAGQATTDPAADVNQPKPLPDESTVITGETVVGVKGEEVERTLRDDETTSTAGEQLKPEDDAVVNQDPDQPATTDEQKPGLKLGGGLKING